MQTQTALQFLSSFGNNEDAVYVPEAGIKYVTSREQVAEATRGCSPAASGFERFSSGAIGCFNSVTASIIERQKAQLAEEKSRHKEIEAAHDWTLRNRGDFEVQVAVESLLASQKSLLEAHSSLLSKLEKSIQTSARSLGVLRKEEAAQRRLENELRASINPGETDPDAAIVYEDRKKEVQALGQKITQYAVRLVDLALASSFISGKMVEEGRRYDLNSEQINKEILKSYIELIQKYGDVLDQQGPLDRFLASLRRGIQGLFVTLLKVGLAVGGVFLAYKGVQYIGRKMDSSSRDDGIEDIDDLQDVASLDLMQLQAPSVEVVDEPPVDAKQIAHL